MMPTKTWWGQRFMDALERFTDSARLMRGRAYASDHRIKTWQLMNGVIIAKVRGNVNPYYGVYEEPTYQVKVQMAQLTTSQWQKVMAIVGKRADFIARLLIEEIPESIETVFAEEGVYLLPKSYKDFKVSCDCPDHVTPCKHIAGVCLRLAQAFDQEPLLLFEMRGLPSKQMRQELLKSPLGKILANVRETGSDIFAPVDHLFARPIPIPIPSEVTLNLFWHGTRPLPKELEAPEEAMIPALVIKSGGDYPGFWRKQSSFIEVMEEFYIRMRKASMREL